MPQLMPTQVTVGVDTHADVHVAVAKDSFGRRLDTTAIPTTPAGYAELLGWAQRLGQIEAWGIEGTGSSGPGLSRFLRAATAAPKLVALFGVGSDSAGALLVAAGDNPDRLRSDAAFAMLCGASPIQASSGKTQRHRLNRGGDRQANAALHRIVVARLRHDQPTRTTWPAASARASPRRKPSAA